jgi:hypothetical protein
MGCPARQGDDEASLGLDKRKGLTLHIATVRGKKGA